MERLDKRRSDFEAHGARIVGISVDPIAKSEELSERLGLGFPLLSDEDATVIRAYGVFHAEKRIALPAVVIVDRDGIVRWRRVSDSVTDRPDEDVLLNVVSRLPGAPR